ncbi:Nucleoside-diphosphate-sugar epimerase [Cyclobacterium lianum]|uniref:Nucleoside-diphosphate-sugar epimerase n=1 Tax=Cyclobacterium lianum TaxID=388280 RepID=A0A1M7JIU7_9BACT|nr:NAD(P)-binding domain-containing protein [Cyclobacterium lianum]SHM52944.1 Nucleoside-diphosphate-sugar epimerase [Cyclobacterium lianum]
MKISIIGLGWLGTPLARELQQQGHQVRGTSTSREKCDSLNTAGICCFQFVLAPYPKLPVPEALFDADLLLINIPPSTRTKPADFHPKQINQLKNLITEHQISKILYVSATSVYPSENQLARESTVLSLANTGNPSLLNAENLLWKKKGYDLTVIRFGGLLGDDRIPGKYFSGKENVAGHPPVNYIHRRDAVRAVSWILDKDLWNETYNIVSPEHPSKKEVFEKNAAECGFPPPVSYESPARQKWKKIGTEKWEKTGFQFMYPDPLDFTYRL